MPALPSVPATLEALQASATGILNKIAALPIEQLMVSLSKTADGLEQIVNAPELQRAAASSDRQSTICGRSSPRSTRARRPARQREQRGAGGSDHPPRRPGRHRLDPADDRLGSALTNNAENLMQELTRAARSIRVFADYLERNPQALIRGKTGEPDGEAGRSRPCAR